MVRTTEYLAYRVIGSPLEPALRTVRDCKESWYRLRGKYPEWHALWNEKRAIEQVLCRLIQPRMNCLDIGCHLGAMLSRLCRYAPHGKHTAFEPTPYKAAWLRKKYPSVAIEELALSDTPGKATFHLYEGKSGFNSLRPNRWMDMQPQGVTVQCVRLDDLITPRERIGFIKVDVEGGELAVLRGATALLRRDHPSILFESTLGGLEAVDLTPQHLYDFLTENDYQIFVCADWLAGRPALGAATFAQLHQPPVQALNFLALPKDYATI